MRCPTLTDLPLPHNGETGWPWTLGTPLPCFDPFDPFFFRAILILNISSWTAAVPTIRWK